MRELSEVIQSIIHVIPSDNASLLADLEDLKSSPLFAAPELQGMFWRMTAEVLSDHFGEQELNEWRSAVVNIWNETTG